MKIDDLREHGFYGVNYLLIGAEPTTLEGLKIRLLDDHIRYTGWGPFWFPTRQGISPQVVDEKTYECVHEGGATNQVEKWRATIDGEFTIVRAYDLDLLDEPGRHINLIFPIWRIAEMMLHSGRMGKAFAADEVEFTVIFTGLQNRRLTTKETPRRLLSGEYRTGASEYEKAITVPIADIDRQVVEFTVKILRPFYALFQFPLSESLVKEEVSRMRSVPL